MESQSQSPFIQKIQCPLCSKEFPDKLSWKNHMKEKHIDEILSNLMKPSPKKKRSPSKTKITKPNTLISHYSEDEFKSSLENDTEEPNLRPGRPSKKLKISIENNQNQQTSTSITNTSNKEENEPNSKVSIEKYENKLLASLGELGLLLRLYLGGNPKKKTENGLFLLPYEPLYNFKKIYEELAPQHKDDICKKLLNLHNDPIFWNEVNKAKDTSFLEHCKDDPYKIIVGLLNYLSKNIKMIFLKEIAAIFIGFLIYLRSNYPIGNEQNRFNYLEDYSLRWEKYITSKHFCSDELSNFKLINPNFRVQIDKNKDTINDITSKDYYSKYKHWNEGNFVNKFLEILYPLLSARRIITFFKGKSEDQ